MQIHSPTKILFLAANPKNTTQLRLDEEIREIQQSLKLAKDRDQFQVSQNWATRTQDIQKVMLEDTTPQIVHFSGHGEDESDGDGGLVFEDGQGNAKLVSSEALAGLFSLFEKEVQCVLLNACYSDVQAKAIAQSIPYVIGMSQAIGDTAALKFATGFYGALAAGKTIDLAYKFGCNNIQLELTGNEHLTPVLIKKSTLAPVTTANPMYVDRPPIEAECYREIEQPGALIVIKASHRMGKSWLMHQMLNHASSQQQVIKLSFRAADREILQSKETFLKWFCYSISRELKLSSSVNDAWQDYLSHRQNCTEYFEEYVLTAIESSLVIGLDDIDKLFEHLDVAIEFLSLLRLWYEDSRNFSSIWRKLRLVLAVWREVDNIPLPPHQSPFNVGLKAELQEFNVSQVQELVQRHQLQWSVAEVEQLMNVVDGHPYLLQVALRTIASGQLTLGQFCQTAATEEGVYREHLHEHLQSLERDPELMMALGQMVAMDQPVSLKVREQSKLCNVGLGELRGNGVIPLCNLYRDYFRERLKTG
jgi:AAA-like domain/CHAT domain